MGMRYEEVEAKGIKFFLADKYGKEMARAYLYVMNNDLHKRPFGLLEDVFVDESCRGEGYGSEVVNSVIEEAKSRNCYKLICTSRHSKPHVHKMYKGLGFYEQGLEFRIDFG